MQEYRHMVAEDGTGGGEGPKKREKPNILQQIVKGRISTSSVEKEYKALRSGSVDFVPYPPRIGVVDRVSDQTLITGYELDQRAIDCNVVIMYGHGKVAMMHVSPQTIPDEYVARRLTHPFNTNVDERLQKMVYSLGGVIEAVQIIAGDELLARQLREYLTGGANVWGRYTRDMLIEESKITTFPLGTTAKEVLADVKSQTTFVADYTRGTYEKFPV